MWTSKRTFRLTVRNKYEALQDLLDEGNMDIDTQWQQIKEMWTSTCSEVLGKKKYQQKTVFLQTLSTKCK